VPSLVDKRTVTGVAVLLLKLTVQTVGCPSGALGLLIEIVGSGATGIGGVVSVSSVGSGSVVPGGGATVAVFAPIVPEAGAVPFTVMVIAFAAPTPTVAVRLTLPVPDAAPQLDVPEAAQVQVTLANSTGTVSVIVAPVAIAGPALVTTSR